MKQWLPPSGHGYEHGEKHMVKNTMNHCLKETGCSKRDPRRGAALLFSIFIIAFMTLMVINVLDTTTLATSALRNSMDYRRALFLANAGVHEMAAQFEHEDKATWLATLTEGAYPADDTYEATFVYDTSVTELVETHALVISKGVSHGVTRTVCAKIELKLP